MARLGVKDVSTVMQQTHLTWFGHLERMGNENWVGKCRSLETDGAVGRGRPNIYNRTKLFKVIC